MGRLYLFRMEQQLRLRSWWLGSHAGFRQLENSVDRYAVWASASNAAPS